MSLGLGDRVAPVVEDRRAQRGVGARAQDLDEVLELSDRIAVFYNGRVVGVVEAADANRQQIGLMMAGAS